MNVIARGFIGTRISVVVRSRRRPVARRSQRLAAIFRMMTEQRVRVVRALAGQAEGLSAAQIGDLCKIASHELDPLLVRLTARGKIVAVWDHARIARRRLYRSCTKT